MRLKSFTHDNITLSEVVLLEGVPHVTRRAVGEWLGYSDPQKAVDNIIDRNPHIEAYSTPLNLKGVDGKKRYLQVLSPMGLMLTAMESGQPRAVKMKIDIAEFVLEYSQSPQRSRAGGTEKSGWAELKEIGNTIKFIRSAPNDELTALYTEKFEALLGRPVPRPKPPQDDPVVAEFWDVCERLESIGVPVNHSGELETYAINLNDVLIKAHTHGFPVPDGVILKRRLKSSVSRPLLRRAAIRSVIEKKPIKCWVFRLANGVDETTEMTIH